jgi:hypothetical protein
MSKKNETDIWTPDPEKEKRYRELAEMYLNMDDLLNAGVMFEKARFCSRSAMYNEMRKKFNETATGGTTKREKATIKGDK